MEVDPITAGIGTALAAVLVAVVRLGLQRIELVILAAIERGWIREHRRTRGNTLPPPIAKRDEWPEDETTDITALITRERARRKTERQRSRGERPPRPGTHHD